MKVIYSIKSMKYEKKRVILCHVVYYTFMILIILIAFLTMIYTAKSLYVDIHNNSNNESGNAAKQQQQRSDFIHETIGVPEIKFNLLSSTSSKVFNKLVPHDTKEERNALKALKRITSLFTTPLSIDEDIELDEITSRSDIIEIEVPVIGNEFTRKSHENDEDIDYSNEREEMAQSSGYVEINVLPTSTTLMSKTETTNFQDTDDIETTIQNYQQTVPTNLLHFTTTSKSPLIESTHIHSVESRLVDQYHVNLNNFDEDNNIKNVIDDSKYRKYNDIKVGTKRHAFPFNVKIMVNDDDQQWSCKGKQSCSQVNFAKTKENDQEYYSDEKDTDSDLFFDNEPEKINAIKSRRAANDGFFNAFNGISLTPAPRNNFGVSNSLRLLKKPSFIERLETESSLERSERVNKDLSNLMKFVSVWAHVDKFVSDRARSLIRRLAYMTDEDYVDHLVGSRKRENNLKAVAEQADEPFT